MIDVAQFGTALYPLRPSSLPDFVACPMSVLLRFGDHDEGNRGSQTGSVVHHAIQAFHRVPGGDPVAASEAMAEALTTFPEADRKRASRWLASYIADPTNSEATVVACEMPVKLVYRGVHIEGTLDQVRRQERDMLLVWDVKSGTYYTSEENVMQYQVQQAAYVLAARQTLGLDVRPGGLIIAAGYDKPLGKRHLPMGVDVDDCKALLDAVVHDVEGIRAGKRLFRSTVGACGFCRYKPFPACRKTASLVLGGQQGESQ